MRRRSFKVGVSHSNGQFFLVDKKDTLGEDYPSLLLVNNTGSLVWPKTYKEGYYSFNNLSRIQEGNLILSVDTLLYQDTRTDPTSKQIYKLDINGNIIWRHINSDKVL